MLRMLGGNAGMEPGEYGQSSVLEEGRKIELIHRMSQKLASNGLIIQATRGVWPRKM